MILTIRNYLNKKHLKNTRTLIWDLDGTLHRSQQLAKQVYAQMVNLYSTVKHLNPHQTKQILKNKPGDITLGEFIAQNTNLSAKEIILKIENNIHRPSFINKNNNHTLAKAIHNTPKLKKYTHMILTNTTHKNALSTLKTIGIDPNIFDKIFSIDHLQHPKPHQSAFQTIVNFLKLPPEQILIIGDNLHHDIIPAKQSGLKTCWLYNNQHSPSTDFTFTSLDHFIQFLSRHS